MAIAGIIAEYNPFHLGHQWQICTLRQRLGQDTPVVCAMSGNWVQRGDAAILEKHTRAAMAIRGGADLVLELPLTWCTASAERFARGGVGLLAATGVVDTLVFGSESGDLPLLQRAADCLNDRDFSPRLKQAMAGGRSFAEGRQIVLSQTLGQGFWDTRTHPNDQLAMEYLRAMEGSGLSPLALPRVGADHDGALCEGIAPATLLRKMLLAGEDITPYLPPESCPEAWDTAALDRNLRGVLYRLRTMEAQDFLRLPDCSEGLEHRLVRAARQGCTLEQVCQLAKTRRYAYARLRRMVVWSYLGLEKTDFTPTLPYLRPLACNARGQQLLHRMKKTATLPILTRPAAARQLGAEAFCHMERESRATDLWQLCLKQPGPGGTEWTRGMAILP